MALSLGERQYTAKGIRQTGEFSVSYPSVDQAVLADYLGLVHGDKEDKSKHVEIFEGSLPSAPMVRECPVSLECRVTQTIDLPHDYLFIGEVINVYAIGERAHRRQDRPAQAPALHAHHARQQLLERWASASAPPGTSGKALLKP